MSFLTFISINVKAQRIAVKTNMLYDVVGVASLVSANIVWGGFNIDKLHIGGLYGKHRQGHFAGVGVGAGYHLILNHRLSLDFTLSGDFVKTRCDRYREGNLPYREGKFNSYAILPIGTGISLVVML